MTVEDPGIDTDKPIQGVIGEDVLRKVFRESGLSPNAQRVFRYLLVERDRGEGVMIPCTDNQIALALNLCDRTVRRLRIELVKKGFIRGTKRRFDPVTGKCKPTLYDIQPGRRKIEVSYGKDRTDKESVADHRTDDPSDILSGEVLRTSKGAEDAAPASEGGAASPELLNLLKAEVEKYPPDKTGLGDFLFFERVQFPEGTPEEEIESVLRSVWNQANGKKVPA